MLLKNNGTKDAVLGCGQYNLVIKVGETEDIPEPLVEAFRLRFSELSNVNDDDSDAQNEAVSDEGKAEVLDRLPKIIRRKREVKNA